MTGVRSAVALLLGRLRGPRSNPYLAPWRHRAPGDLTGGRP